METPDVLDIDLMEGQVIPEEAAAIEFVYSAFNWRRSSSVSVNDRHRSNHHSRRPLIDRSRASTRSGGSDQKTGSSVPACCGGAVGNMRMAKEALAEGVSLIIW